MGAEEPLHWIYQRRSEAQESRKRRKSAATIDQPKRAWTSRNFSAPQASSWRFNRTKSYEAAHPNEQHRSLLPQDDPSRYSDIDRCTSSHVTSPYPNDTFASPSRPPHANRRESDAGIRSSSKWSSANTFGYVRWPDGQDAFHRAFEGGLLQHTDEAAIYGG